MPKGEQSLRKRVASKKYFFLVMKFLKSEYNSIKELIETGEHDYSKFSFVKKKGCLNVIWEGKNEPFIFFRKKETVLNDNMQFEDRLTYFLGPKKEIEVSNWEEVLRYFKAFLAQ